MTEQIFQLTDEERGLSSALGQSIRNEIIDHGGVIPFSRYMELALYTPHLGYYSNPLHKFGSGGDFITAPLISPLFGMVLARQIDELWDAQQSRQILEFGAGNGQLALSILANLTYEIEAYYILELSANLVARQRELLAEQIPHLLHKVVWLTELPETFSGIILANEVLDAQPCELVLFNHDSVTGVGVGVNEVQDFIWKSYPLVGESLDIARELSLPYCDYRSEINLASRGFMRTLAQILVKGAILLIDYGYGECEYYHPQKTRGTLRGFYRHQVLDEVLINPGLFDITASVNWSAIAQSGIAGDLELIGYTTQANFLLNCGLTHILEQQKMIVSESQYLQYSNQANQLCASNQMGELFKVMGFSRGLDLESWSGFSNGDRSHLL